MPVSAKNYYPISLDLDGKHCLIVGGGAVAVQKARALLRCAARVTVVAPQLSPAMSRLVRQDMVRHVAARFKTRHLKGMALVIAATDDEAVNAAVAAQARRRRVWVNVVDEPGRCDFIVPAVARRGPLVVAVSTGGASPVAARQLRDDMARMLPCYAQLARLLGRARDGIKARCPDMARRRKVYRQIIEGGVLDLIRRGDRAAAARLVRRVVGRETGDERR